VRERGVNQPMAAARTQAEVLRFTSGVSGLSLHALTFGTIEKPRMILMSPLPGSTVPYGFQTRFPNGRQPGIPSYSRAALYWALSRRQNRSSSRSP